MKRMCSVKTGSRRVFQKRSNPGFYNRKPGKYTLIHPIERVMIVTYRSCQLQRILRLNMDVITLKRL